MFIPNSGDDENYPILDGSASNAEDGDEIDDMETRANTLIIQSELEETQNNIMGMICITISIFLLLSASSIFIYVSTQLKVSLLQTLLVVNAAQHCIAWVLWSVPSSITGRPEHVKKWYGAKDSRSLLWLRGFLYFCDQYFYWTAISLLPLGDAECINFLCPIYIAFGARIMFKERFSSSFPVVFILTVCGVMILSQPPWITDLFPSDGSQRYFNGEPINARGLVSICISCVCWSLLSLIVRRLPNSHWTQMELVSSLQSFAVWTPMLIAINFGFKNIDINFDLDNEGTWDLSWNPMMLSVAIAILMIVAMIFFNVGYQRGEATKVSWLEYVNVPVGFLYQYLIFNESPNIYEIVGASVMLLTAFIQILEQSVHYRTTKGRLAERKQFHERSANGMISMNIPW